MLLVFSRCSKVTYQNASSMDPVLSHTIMAASTFSIIGTYASPRASTCCSQKEPSSFPSSTSHTTWSLLNMRCGAETMQTSYLQAACASSIDAYVMFTTVYPINILLPHVPDQFSFSVKVLIITIETLSSNIIRFECRWTSRHSWIVQPSHSQLPY